MINLLHIGNYANDGFVKICTISVNPATLNWELNDQHSYLFCDHTSWVYAVVNGEAVEKIGETGQPLGIRSKKYTANNQPLCGTTNRFGRLRSMGHITDTKSNDTDVTIRRELHNDALAGNVSLWARRCSQSKSTINVNGKPIEIVQSFHKQLEKAYLTAISDKHNMLPRLNKCKI